MHLTTPPLRTLASSVRLSEPEYVALATAATRRGLTLSSFLRSAALVEAGRYGPVADATREPAA
jgi:uncharacterized protein (DUF1778 family)